MPFGSRGRSFLRTLFRARELDASLDRELEDYVAELTERNLRSGVDPVEARRRALLMSGGTQQIKESVRADRIGGGVMTWGRDVRMSWRGFGRRPAFAVVAVLSLSLGIGANALVFSLVNAALLRPLPYPEPERLVVVWLTPPNEPEARFGTNTGVYFSLRDKSRSFEILGTGRLNEAFSVAPSSELTTEWIPSQWFSRDLIATLGIEPMMGDWPDEPFGLAISHGLWQRMFGGSPDVLGRIFEVGGNAGVVTAVMPEGYHLMNPDVGLWVYQPDENMANANRSPNRLFTIVGRLDPGVTVAQAQAELDQLAPVIGEEFAETHLGWGFHVEPLHDAYVGRLGQSLWIFQAAVFFVLLIACANIGALCLSQAAARQREYAIRSAVGSGRWALVRQLVTDNLLLSGIGAALGLVLAWVGLAILVRSGVEGLPRLAEAAIDVRVMVFAAFLAVVTGIVFGVLPALGASRPNLMSVLREASWGSSTGLGHQRIRNMFVVAQVSLALTVLVGSGLLIRSFSLVSTMELGFDTGNLVVLEVPFPRTYYTNTGENTPAGGYLVEFDTRFADQSERIVEGLRGLPGVESVAASPTPPLGEAAERVGYGLPGEVLLAAERTARSAEWYPVSPEFFGTLGIPLVAGRTFTGLDRRPTRPVAVVSRALADRLWPDSDAVGQVIQTDIVDDPPREVVGVVGNVRQDRYQTVAQPQIYIPRLQVPARMDMAVAQRFLSTSIIARADTELAGLFPMLQERIQEIDRSLPVARIRSVEDYASGQLRDLRRATVLLGAFGAISVSLALIGVFGVIANVVTQRRTEIGIRMALGARAASVIRLVLGQGLAVIGIGLVTGTVAALFFSRLTGSLLYGVSPTDPFSFVMSVALLGAVALLACYLPARRALKIDPVVTLRNN